MADLDTLRKKVDELDERMLDLLNARSEIALKIGKLKAKTHRDIYVPDREKKLLDRLLKKNKGTFPAHALRSVFREILSASRALQTPLRVAYLGPQASFTHVAAIKNFGHSTEFIPESSISKVFDTIEHGQAVCGVVPIENSTEGVVGATLDRFIDSSLRITAEITLPVAHHLLSRQSGLRSIRRIYSHPQAIAQCRNWLEENRPGIPLVEVESTARAAERAAEENGSAAVAGEQAAELYGLKILKRHIEDNSNNMTRFLVLSKKSPSRTGKDKTSLLFSVKDEVGVLYRMLEPFYKERINLTKIESRPLKRRAWEYIFFIDLDGHLSEASVARAVRGLERRCTFMKLLGSYPKAT